MSRHQARERALTLLYEAELKNVPTSEVVDGLPVPPDPYVVALVSTVEQRRGEIDALIGRAAIGWEVDRMATVDRNVLRLAMAELLESTDVPTAVVLDEAVELAAVYSTDDSGRFVNGVLATLAAEVRGSTGRNESRADRPGSERRADRPGSERRADRPGSETV